MLVNELMSELLTATINPAIATGRLEDLRRREEAKTVTVINQSLNEKAEKGV